MKRLGSILLTGFFLVVLVGCASNLSGVDQFKTINEPPSYLNNTREGFATLGVSSTIRSGQSVGGYLNDQNLDGYGDRDWYLLNDVGSGFPITVELIGSSSGDFDLAIWKDGKWSSYDDSSSSSARLNDTAGSTTWIWVGIWSGRGSYTLKVNTTTSGACGGGRVEAPVPTYLTSYIQKACYDNGVWSGAGVQLTLTFDGAASCRNNFQFCDVFARFIVYNKLWRGNRPLESVTTEIWWHVDQRRPDEVINIQYMCSDLHLWEKPFYGCSE